MNNHTLLELFAAFMPETYKGLCALRPLIGKRADDARMTEIFASLPRISIDYGIMEKSSGLRLIPAEFAGTTSETGRPWRGSCTRRDGQYAQGSHVSLDSNGCIIYAQSETIATFGVSDLVVVQAYGKFLLFKDKAADLKRLVTALGPQEG